MQVCAALNASFVNMSSSGKGVHPIFYIYSFIIYYCIIHTKKVYFFCRRLFAFIAKLETNQVLEETLVKYLETRRWIAAAVKNYRFSSSKEYFQQCY